MRYATLLAILASALGAHAQSSLDELPPELRLNGSETVKAFGDPGEIARQSTLTILAEGKAIALATAIDADGYLVTKASELEGAKELTGISPAGDELEITLLAADPKSDLALLKSKPGCATPVVWGNPDSLVQGTWVASMSHEASALMIGVVSATRRAIKRRPGVLGVQLDPNDDPDELGVAVDSFGPNSPAQKEGILAGDLIVRVEDTEIKARKDLAEQITKFDPLDEVRIKILRGEEGIPFLVTLNYMSNVFDMLDRNQKMSGQTSKRKAGFADVLQHELPLPPKAMGGPLVDLEGKTMGVNIARADRVTTFALPANVVTQVAADLKAKAAERAQ